MGKKTVAELDVEVQALKESNREQHGQILSNVKEIKDLIWNKFYENGYDERMNNFDKYLKKQETRDDNKTYFKRGIKQQVISAVVGGGIMLLIFWLFYLLTGFAG